MKKFAYPQSIKVICFFTLVCQAAGIPVLAAPPDSGSALESVKPPAVQMPAIKPPEIIVEDQQLPSDTDSQQKFLVKAFRITGESPLPAEELTNLIDSEAGKEITLGDLNKLANRITQHLRQQGYLVAFAYIPPQEIKDGILEMRVVPGKYGQVKVTGTARFNQEHLKDMLFCAKPGLLITKGPLERALLLINDLSGVSFKATLTPGETAGTADLVIAAADTAPISAILFADNWGNRYTGRTRYGTQISVNNFAGNGDAFILGGLSTFDGINDYNFGYSAPLGHNGAKLDVKYSHVGYTLGEDFADMGATGRAAIMSYSVSYPLVRSRTFSLYGTLGYDKKHLQDDLDTFSTHSPRSSSLWNLGLTGNFADNWLGGGANAFGLTHYRGNLSFKDDIALAIDDATAQTDGNFSKTVLTYQRQQYIANNLNFNVNFTGQLADKNLDSSEKLFLGGADGVRAYPQGEASGDQGYKFTGEFRWRLPGLSGETSNLYLNTFYDYGNVMINKRPYSTGDNRRSLMATGLGLMWARDRDLAVRMDYAWKLHKEATDTDNNGRFWLQGVKYF
ncbi:ShlB/FhaC/HecB family hemolysin secretion/activation protein [Sporomusa aerivorans]|uniref:ShlB/FhaC/HecB family hemolysin secretion/activation protein n=1 Tax=Sporomusa aerivorans TaxID=204936 RepID=UPI00352B6A98